MLLRNRPTQTTSAPPPPARPGYGLLSPRTVAVLARLAAYRVDYVLVGSVAETIMTGQGSEGPITIVPAPYGRNLERLGRVRTALGEEGITIETHLELSNRYQELLYDTRTHEVAEGVKVEVASTEHLARHRHEARGGVEPEISVRRLG